MFLLFGFGLMMVMRWQLAYPFQPIPIIGGLLGDTRAPGGIMLPEFYNQLGAMHGTIMVFLGVVPLAVGGFGNFVLPLQIGAPDMAFPKLNMASYWSFFLGGVRDARQLRRPGRRGQLRLDVLRPAVGHRHDGPDDVAGRDDLPDHVVAARLGEPSSSPPCSCGRPA